MMTPFFIVNAPRSGSTLLCAVLNAHPRVSVYVESVWFSRHAVKLSRFLSQPPERRDPAILDYLKSVDETVQIKLVLEDEVAVRKAVHVSQGNP